MTIPARYAYLAVFIAVWGHATSEFFAVLSGLSGPEISVWRYLLGGPGLVLAALALPGSRNLVRPLREDGPQLVWLSLIGVSAAYLAFHWALDFASVVQVATLVTTIPIFVGLANLMVNGERPSSVKIASGLCALAGLVLLITDGALDLLSGQSTSLFGVSLAIACAALVAYYAVKIKPLIARHGALDITALSLMIGGIGLWVGVGLGWSIWVDPSTLFERPTIAWASILTLAFWNTTITQFLWIGGLAAAQDITRASYLFFLKPVIAAGLAVPLLGETVSWLQAGAIAVVTGSVLVELCWPYVLGFAGRSPQAVRGARPAIERRSPASGKDQTQSLQDPMKIEPKKL